MYPSFNELRKAAKDSGPKTHSITLSLLADSSAQFLVSALKGMGNLSDVELDVYDGGYGQSEQEIMNPTSQFNEAQSEFVLLFHSSEYLLEKFRKTVLTERSTFAQDSIGQIKSWIEQIDGTSKILLNTYPFISSGVFGNFSSSVESSFEFQLSKLNHMLRELAASNGRVFISDIQLLQNFSGLKGRIDQKFSVSSKLNYSIDIIPAIAKNYLDIIKTAKGIGLKKCLILDLDNTTWGGVIGDDGLEGIQLGELGLGRAFDRVQHWAKDLKNRGIILCICSKNTDHIAKEPFEKHPDMTLALDDISVFVANWENKADNIRHIQEVLNIGFDSMVFIDDNPFERNLVRQELPAVEVPELPDDPAEYYPFLSALNLFETASYSAEDGSRTKRYQEEAKRVEAKRTYGSIDEYLGSLEMEATSEPFNKFSFPRVAQLTQRSNQFNLRTVRYTEEDIERLTNSSEYKTMQISLSDKYGEYGIVGLIIGKIEGETLFLDTWIMSCRVLKRGLEKFVLNELVELARDNNLKVIKGEYLRTPKNALVEDHYKDLGFAGEDVLWTMSVESAIPLSNHIEKKEISLR